MNTSLNCIYKRIQEVDEIVIVGAGYRGKELWNHLTEVGASITFFFDNNATPESVIENIKVISPCKVEEKNCVYIIAVDAVASRRELRSQLLELGIKKEDIMTYCQRRDYDYLSNLDERYYQDEIQAMYYEKFGKKINWQNPVTYNEKINWEKINVKDERRTRLADKYLVRDWVEEQIGEQHLTKLYDVWDDAEEIDFDVLPNAFALKLNNGSNRNIIVRDKSKVDYEEIRKKLNAWKECNFAYGGYEFHYRDIVPKILCEEYMEGVAENIYDYNIYCFHGEPMYIWCIKGSHKPDCRASFYNKDWEMQPFSYGYPKDPVVAPRPEKLEEMLELSRVLCKDFEHVRVDWYNLPDGRVIFGEMTFSTWAGLKHWEPEEYDAVFGKLI